MELIYKLFIFALLSFSLIQSKYSKINIDIDKQELNDLLENKSESSTKKTSAIKINEQLSDTFHNFTISARWFPYFVTNRLTNCLIISNEFGFEIVSILNTLLTYKVEDYYSHARFKVEHLIMKTNDYFTPLNSTNTTDTSNTTNTNNKIITNVDCLNFANDLNDGFNWMMKQLANLSVSSQIRSKIQQMKNGGNVELTNILALLSDGKTNEALNSFAIFLKDLMFVIINKHG